MYVCVCVFVSFCACGCVRGAGSIEFIQRGKPQELWARKKIEKKWSMLQRPPIGLPEVAAVINSLLNLPSFVKSFHTFAINFIEDTTAAEVLQLWIDSKSFRDLVNSSSSHSTCDQQLVCRRFSEWWRCVNSKVSLLEGLQIDHNHSLMSDLDHHFSRLSSASPFGQVLTILPLLYPLEDTCLSYLKAVLLPAFYRDPIGKLFFGLPSPRRRSLPLSIC